MNVLTLTGHLVTDRRDTTRGLVCEFRHASNPVVAPQVGRP